MGVHFCLDKAPCISFLGCCESVLFSDYRRLSASFVVYSHSGIIHVEGLWVQRKQVPGSRAPALPKWISIPCSAEMPVTLQN